MGFDDPGGVVRELQRAMRVKLGIPGGEHELLGGEDVVRTLGHRGG